MKVKTKKKSQPGTSKMYSVKWLSVYYDRFLFHHLQMLKEKHWPWQKKEEMAATIWPTKKKKQLYDKLRNPNLLLRLKAVSSTIST